jgi:ketosteroid isomerase-like protein
MSEENVETARTVFEAFVEGMNRDDPGAAFDTDGLAPDAEWIPVPLAGAAQVYRGREGFIEFMEAWTEDFDDWSIRLDRLTAAGDDRVVATGHQSATGKASGVPVEWHFGQIFELEGGRVVRIRVYADPTEALEAAGLSE